MQSKTAVIIHGNYLVVMLMLTGEGLLASSPPETRDDAEGVQCEEESRLLLRILEREHFYSDRR